MRSTILCLTLLLSLAACETTTDPFIGIGGGGISPAQASGNWTFTVHPNTLSCSSGSLADGALLTARFDVSSDGTVTTASFWQTPPSTGAFPLSGAVDFDSGFASAFMAASSSTVMELRGTMTSTGSFSGSLSDPAAGFFPVFAACSYTTTGVKG